MQHVINKNDLYEHDRIADRFLPIALSFRVNSPERRTDHPSKDARTCGLPAINFHYNNYYEDRALSP